MKALSDHVAACVEQVLQDVPASARKDVYIVSAWLGEDLTASIGWNTSRHVRARRPLHSRFAWGVLEWSRWEFECPSASVVCDPLEDPLGFALCCHWLAQAEPDDEHASFRALIDDVMHDMHRDGRIAAALGHAVALIVEGELQTCSA
jgi:hypothetical protein